MKLLRNLFIYVLCVGLFFCIAPIAFAGEVMTFDQRIAELRIKFPNGAYWNHLVTDASNRGDTLKDNWDESFMDSVTNYRCATHNGIAGIGQYDCNYFDGGLQCWGFAAKIFYDVFGTRQSSVGKRTDVENIMPGDYLRFGSDSDGHSAFVLSRNGDTLNVVECNNLNYGSYDNIHWDGEANIYSVTYFRHASNYDDVPFTAAEPSVGFEPWESSLTYIGETDASIGRIVRVYNGNCSEVGMTLYDSTGNWLGSAMNPTYENEKNYFKINEEIGVYLKGGTTYQYQFYAIVNGKTYFDNMTSFTTSPCTHNLEHYVAVDATESSAGNIEYWYCKKCGRYFKDFACSQETTSTAVIIPKLEPVLADVNGIQCRSIQEINETLAQTESPVITLVPGRIIPYTAQSGGQSMVELVKQNKRLLISKDATLDLNGGTLCGLVIQSADLLVKDSKNGIGKVTGQFKFNYLATVGGSSHSKAPTLTVTGGSYIPEFVVSQYLAPGYTFENINGWDEVRPIVYTIRYAANGGTGAPEAQTKKYDETMKLSTLIPTHAGYIFLGWAESADATVATYQPGGEFVKNADTTLYAVWQKKEPDFTLPAALKEIGEEAFADCAFGYVHIPDGVTRIERRAFADCPNLHDVDIPESATSIDPTAFAGTSGLTIHSADGSYAEFYAGKYGFAFIPVA